MVNKKLSQEKRQQNREQSLARLEDFVFDNGPHVSISIKNKGAHIIITMSDNSVLNFWPGTGLWEDWDGVRSRGVFPLIKRLERKIDYIKSELRLNKKECYQCGNKVNYLFDDSRCSKCTRIDPETMV